MSYFYSMSTLQDEVYTPDMILLGVFGYTNTISEIDIQENIMSLLLQVRFYCAKVERKFLSIRT